MTNTPPGGWRYLVPETGRTIGPYTGFAQLRDNLASHYSASGYAMPSDILDKVEGQICSHTPEYCEESNIISRVASTMRRLSHTFHTAHQCLVTLVSNRAGSGEKPTMELASERAATCAACPMNRQVEGCSGCNFAALNSLVEKIVGGAKTPSDNHLKFCAVCHCNLRAKVWTKLKAIELGMSEAQRADLPPTCWIITEGTK